MTTTPAAAPVGRTQTAPSSTRASPATGPDGAERLFPSASGSVEVAGPYVAWTIEGGQREGGIVVLYDAVADREVLRAGAVDGPRLDAIGLQPDGKLLVAVDRRMAPDLRAGEDTAWLSPAEPGLHRLGIRPEIVRGFVRDRVLTLTAETSAAFEPAPRPLGRTRVGLAGLDGSRRVLASTHGGARISYADYDGARVALAAMTCDGTRILLRSAAEPPLTLAEDGLCPLEVRGPVVVDFGTDRSSESRFVPRARVRVRCAAWTLRPCGHLVLRTLDGQQLSLKAYSFRRDGTFSLTLDDDAARRIARDGSLAVRLEMRGNRDPAVLVQRHATARLRMEPRDLARLRRCVSVQRRPGRACPA